VKPKLGQILVSKFLVKTKRFRSFVGFLILTILVSAQRLEAAGDFPALVKDLERAVVLGDVGKLVHYRQELEGASKEWGVDEGLRQYTLAYVSWRLVPLVNEKEGGRTLNQAEEILSGLVRKDPDNAEALALLGSVYGNQITNAWKGMRLGPKASKALEQAESISPDNPRVILQQAISAFHTPSLFGGGLEAAEEKLRHAEALFEREPASKSWPDWGRIDVYVWLGQVLVKTGDHKGARTAYEKGLSLEPDHAWIRNKLLPALEPVESQDAR